MFPIFRNELLKKLLINNLLTKNSKCVKLNDLTTNQLIIRCVKTSPQLFGTKGIPILMPSLSPTMTTGTIVKWVKKEGENIAPGDLICEVQTDKAIVGLELEEEGILAKILLPNDTQDIKVGTLIALMVEEGKDWKDVEIPVTSQTTSQTDGTKDKVEKSVPKSIESTHLMGPSVKNLLTVFAIDSSQVKSTGPHNTLLKSDVLQYIKDNQLKPKDLSSDTRVSSIGSSVSSSKTQAIPQTQEYNDIELNNMRKTIAKRLTQSKTTIPHSYMSINCSMNGVIKIRKQLKNSGINVSFNDFIIKGTAIALRKVPNVNCIWNESTSSIQISPTVDISVAVATPNGLITPIVKEANNLDVETISTTVKALAEKAKAGKLQPNEFIGGSFSISNLGMFGITEFSAVINPPQSAILAIGSSRLVLDDNEEVHNLVTVTLSFDGRAIEEETAAKFLEVFKTTIEDSIALQKSDGSDNRRLNALIS